MGATALSHEKEAAAVLIVDDERGPRESLQLILKPHFRVFTAGGGDEALEILSRQPIDVVTLDLKMSPVSGSETLTKIRQIAPGLEVVIVTGYGSFESAIDVMRLRAFDYISKPFDSRRILEAVRRAAEARRHPIAEVEEVVPPLSQIVEDVERWQDSAALRLAEVDRASLDRILVRLRTLRSHVYERLRAMRSPANLPEKESE